MEARTEQAMAYLFFLAGFFGGSKPAILLLIWGWSEMTFFSTFRSAISIGNPERLKILEIGFFTKRVVLLLGILALDQ